MWMVVMVMIMVVEGGGCGANNAGNARKKDLLACI